MGVENEQRYRDESGIIQDDYRIDFIKEHLDCAIRAAKEGCNCQGYMLWAFTDNVSPRNAFKNRYVGRNRSGAQPGSSPEKERVLLQTDH